MISSIDIIIRLIISSICGSIIGFQREIADRPAGFRTHVLVCIGSALIMMVSIYPFIGEMRADPSRIASGVITGIGFLGAGTIIRQGSIVKGLTTAASLWTIAGVGLAIGAGFYFAAIATTILVLLVLSGFKIIETRFLKTKGTEFIVVRMQDRPGMLGKVGANLGELSVNIRNIEMTQEQEGIASIRLTVDIPRGVFTETVIENLSGIEGIKTVQWEE